MDLNENLPRNHQDKTYGVPDESVVFTLTQIIEARTRRLVFTMQAIGSDATITTDIETLLLPVDELVKLQTDNPERLGFKSTP